MVNGTNGVALTAACRLLGLAACCAACCAAWYACQVAGVGASGRTALPPV